MYVCTRKSTYVHLRNNRHMCPHMCMCTLNGWALSPTTHIHILPVYVYQVDMCIVKYMHACVCLWFVMFALFNVLCAHIINWWSLARGIVLELCINLCTCCMCTWILHMDSSRRWHRHVYWDAQSCKGAVSQMGSVNSSPWYGSIRFPNRHETSIAITNHHYFDANLTAVAGDAGGCLQFLFALRLWLKPRVTVLLWFFTASHRATGPAVDDWCCLKRNDWLKGWRILGLKRCLVSTMASGDDIKLNMKRMWDEAYGPVSLARPGTAHHDIGWRGWEWVGWVALEMW